jgi:ABC-type ATPase involved in cell division
MQSFNIVVESDVSTSARCRQLEGMFDVPPSKRSRLQFTGELDLDSQPWSVGLIVGPSGAGKSTIAKHLFPAEYGRVYEWGKQSVIDDFAETLSVADISSVCQAVGFNTIPAWLRPFAVLSTGERFRVELARNLIEGGDLIVMDEFTSVVDRQVAQIGANAVQKYVRRNGKRFVAVSCHSDIIDWLQPDWIYEPALSRFVRGLVRRRPSMEVEITRLTYEAWKLFAPFHYLTAELNRVAKCFGLWIGGRLTSFAGLLCRPTKKADVWGVSRLVTLPDWQGLGLAMILACKMGAAHKAIGKRLHTYPAHPSLMRSFDKSPEWALIKRPGEFKGKENQKGFKAMKGNRIDPNNEGRPCAVFEFCGPTMDRAKAEALLA